MNLREDKKEICGAHKYIGDDFGDNFATIKCQLIKNHEGRHEERWDDCILTWDVDGRKNGQ